MVLKYVFVVGDADCVERVAEGDGDGAKLRQFSALDEVAAEPQEADECRPATPHHTI